MPAVFVSHASADKAFVDVFVNEVLRLGCALSTDEIFYSSGAATGIPSGKDLMAFIRDQAEESSLVIAVISTVFQTRPTCIAELGAAWARPGRLFPILVPGLTRSTLDGVLPGLVTRHIDDPELLDELHDAISRITGRYVPTLSWGDHKKRWLADVSTLSGKLGQVPIDPRVATIAALFNGPCMIIERCEGLALDGSQPLRGDLRPIFWPANAEPWQQWRIRSVGDGLVSIVNERDGLALTTDPAEKAGNGSWVTQEEFMGHDSQLWRLTPTDDRFAFVIESKQSAHALDSGKGGSVERKQSPIVWDTHGGPCQQWMIAPLP